MFEILTSILLLILILYLVYYLMADVVPKKAFFVLGIAFVLAIFVINFFAPGRGFHSDLWLVISVPLSPLGLSLLLLFLAVLRVKKEKIEKPGQAMLWTAFAILFFSSLPVIAYELAQAMEQEAVSIEIRKEGLCDGGCPEPTPVAIALLGRNTTQPNIPYRPQIQLTDTGNRILYTAQLYREQLSAGRDLRVIVCTTPRSGLTGDEAALSEVDDIATLLTRFGVPRNRIVPRTDSYTLRRGAEEVQAALNEAGLDEEGVILVTSGIRLRRAAQTFRQLGMEPIPRPSDFYTFQSEGSPQRTLVLQDFLPSVYALQITSEVIEEYLASVYYFLRGWLQPVVY